MALLALVLALPATAGAANRAECDVAWHFTPRFSDASPYLEAEVTWRAGSTNTTELALPRAWGGVELTPLLRDFSTRSAHQWVLDRADPARRTVTHLPRERIAVRYRIDARPANPDRDVIRRRDAYAAIVGPDWFHFVGYAAFVIPVQFDEPRRPRLCVTLDERHGDGWIVSTLGTRRGGHATFALRESARRLRHAVYFGGRFDVRERRIRGRTLWIARRGPWRFDMSALDNAFVMYAPDDLEVPGERFEFLLAHEYLHTWIPRRFGAMGEDEALRYWFSEGFTDFYTHRLLVRDGSWTLDQYAAALDRKIEQYLQSSRPDYDNARVAADFFSDPAIGALPYLRGELLALRWQQALAPKGPDGLDDVVKRLLLPHGVEADAKAPLPLATKRLLDALAASVPDLRADVERYVERGESMAFDALSLGPCFSMRIADKPRFQLGFDRRSVKEGRLTGVEPDGPAYAAGLRDGQPISGFSLYEGDVSRDVSVQLRDEAGKPTSGVAFRPVAAGRRDIPAYTPKPDAGADPACRAWFGLDAHSP